MEKEIAFSRSGTGFVSIGMLLPGTWGKSWRDRSGDAEKPGDSPVHMCVLGICSLQRALGSLAPEQQELLTPQQCQGCQTNWGLIFEILNRRESY